MRIMAVDPDPLGLPSLIRCLMRAYPGSEVVGFRDSMLAYQYGVSHSPDALFTLAQMRRFSGFELARGLRRRWSHVEVYMIWTDDAYRTDALRAGADGYLLKPVTEDSLLSARREAWNP